MKVPREKVDALIMDIKNIQAKCTEAETMFIYHALDKALNKIGWRYADLLTEEKEATPK